MAASAFFSCAPSASASWETSLQAPRHAFLPTRLCRFRLSLLIAPSQHLHRAAAPLAMSSTPSSPTDLDELIKLKNSENPVVVYSKTWCPYCLRVKSLFKEVRVKPFVVELDELADEGEVQAALQRLTGQSTVPNVFIGGKHVGGCEDTLNLHHYKKLIPLLEEANAEFL
ncbi:hypothetical protein L7F22_010109 [Adiantum nelumboides]|nr:hypothetical protein [Adiantum nelumboides]